VCVYDYVILPGLNVDQQACYPVTEAPEKCLISSVLRLKHYQTIPMITNRSFYAELCTITHTHMLHIFPVAKMFTGRRSLCHLCVETEACELKNDEEDVLISHSIIKHVYELFPMAS